MNATPIQTLLLTNIKGKLRIKHQHGGETDVTGDIELAESDSLTLLETREGDRKGSSGTVSLALKVRSSDVRVFKRDKPGVIDVRDSDVIVVQQPCLELSTTAPQRRSNAQPANAPKLAQLVSYFPACLSLGQYFEQDGLPHYQILTPGGTVRVNPVVKV